MAKILSCKIGKTFNAIPRQAHGSDLGCCYKSDAPGSYSTRVLLMYRLFVAYRKD